MERLVKMKCPHCGTVNQKHIDIASYRGVLLENCEENDGGCGKYFVFEWQHEIKITDIYTVTRV